MPLYGRWTLGRVASASAIGPYFFGPRTMGHEHHNIVAVCASAQWLAIATLHASKIIREFCGTAHKVNAAIFMAPGPLGPSGSGHYGGPPKCHSINSRVHIVTTCINNSLPRPSNRNIRRREMGIGPRGPIARDGI